MYGRIPYCVSDFLAWFQILNYLKSGIVCNHCTLWQGRNLSSAAGSHCTDGTGLLVGDQYTGERACRWHRRLLNEARLQRRPLLGGQSVESLAGIPIYIINVFLGLLLYIGYLHNTIFQYCVASMLINQLVSVNTV